MGGTGRISERGRPRALEDLGWGGGRGRGRGLQLHLIGRLVFFWCFGINVVVWI